MGLLDSLFTSSKKENKEDKKLLDCVKKIENSEYGIFVNIMNDLGNYIEEVGKEENPLRLMAYAYARRITAACLCAQGIWGQEEYDYTYNLFLSFQQTTGQTIEFQEDAAAQASELIISYDSRFNKDILMKITSVMTEDASRAITNNKSFSVDDLLELFGN